MASSSATQVEREPTPVRYIECRDEIGEIRATWRALESLFPTLTGHKFLATFDPVAGWYRACVVATPDSEAVTGDLPTATVPAGKYARLRLQGDADALYDLLPAAFAALETNCEIDPGRPRVEFYRRHTEVHVLVPVRD
jgi:hypothetical protein